MALKTYQHGRQFAEAEIYILKNLNHENIMRIYCSQVLKSIRHIIYAIIIILDGIFSLCMEYVQGMSLFDLIPTNDDRHIPEDILSGIALQAILSIFSNC